MVRLGSRKKGTKGRVRVRLGSRRKGIRRDGTYLGYLGFVSGLLAQAKTSCVSTAVVSVTISYRLLVVSHSSSEFLFFPVQPGVGGVSETDCRKRSSAALNISKIGIDLMYDGTTLYRAEAVYEKE